MLASGELVGSGCDLDEVVTGKGELSGGVGRDGGLVEEGAVVVSLPVDGDAAVGAIVVGLDPGEGVGILLIGFLRREMRVKRDLGISRLAWRNTGEIGHHPTRDGTEGVVGEGVHGGIELSVRTSEAVFFGVGIPAFPNGGGAIFNFVSPGGIETTLDELERKVVLAGVGEHGEEGFGAEEAGGHAGVFFGWRGI